MYRLGENMKKLLLLTLIALSLKAEFLEPEIIEETALYKIYCISNTAWIKWNYNNTPPVQMFKPNYTSIPLGCK